MQTSKGHMGFTKDGRRELFEGTDGAFYVAPTCAPLSVHGYRNGARFEAPAHMRDYALRLIS